MAKGKRRRFRNRGRRRAARGWLLLRDVVDAQTALLAVLAAAYGRYAVPLSELIIRQGDHR